MELIVKDLYDANEVKIVQTGAKDFNVSIQPKSGTKFITDTFEINPNESKAAQVGEALHSIVLGNERTTDRIQRCPACFAKRNSINSRRAFEHTCGL